MSKGFRHTEWSYLIRFRASEARTKILDAYRETSGNAVHAAEVMGISHRSLLTYVRRLDLREDIRRIRDLARQRPPPFAPPPPPDSDD